MASEVEQFYGQSADYEWNRLERHRMEFAVTLRALADYLPPPPARILDVGGGPGRYSIALAQRGYSVTLFDLSAPLLDFARGKAAEAGVTLAGYEHGSGTDLSRFPAESFDAVLLMGPLYHLPDEEDRRQAVSEGVRVLKRGGTLFAAFICRYAPLRKAGKVDLGWITARRDEVEQLLNTGQYHSTPGSGFTTAYFAHPVEIVPFMEPLGLQTLDLIACEGVVSMIEEQVNQLRGALWEAWVDVNYRLGKDPCTHGGAEHLLYVVRKP